MEQESAEVCQLNTASTFGGWLKTRLMHADGVSGVISFGRFMHARESVAEAHSTVTAVAIPTIWRLNFNIIMFV